MTPSSSSMLEGGGGELALPLLTEAARRFARRLAALSPRWTPVVRCDQLEGAGAVLTHALVCGFGSMIGGSCKHLQGGGKGEEEGREGREGK